MKREMTWAATRFRVSMLLLVVALLVLGTRPALALLQIDITRGNVEPLPIAVTDLAGPTPQASDTGAKIAEVVRANLARSGLFRPLEPASFIERPRSIDQPPRFGDWRLINAQALVTGQVDAEADGRLRVAFRLWDVFAEQQMTGFVFQTTPENWRRVAHMISDQIYERLTGEKGYFDTRIAYVAESGPRNKRIKRLAIMDQDGANHRYLTDGSDLVLTPRFSPDGEQIVYMAYSDNRARVYLLDLATGRRQVLTDIPGMTFAPRFAPDGRRVVLSLARAGNSDLYLMDLGTRQLTRLTNHPSIDTSASFSPDGRRIVFNSDRGGAQQLYVMNADGSDVQRISFGEGRYATPVWSPRSDMIAFTKIHQGRFYIGVMRPDGSGERLLTEGFSVEAPTWAPNGRVLMFFKETPASRSGAGATSSLWTIDLTGYNERRLLTPGDASDPAWSPLMH